MAKKKNTVMIRKYQGVPGQIQPLANRMVQHLKKIKAEKLINVDYSRGGETISVYLDFDGLKQPFLEQQTESYKKTKSIEITTPILTEERQQLDEIVDKYDKLRMEHEEMFEEACRINDKLKKENDELKADLETKLDAKVRLPLQNAYQVEDALQKCISECEKEKMSILNEGFELAAKQVSQRKLFSGNIEDAIKTLNAREETLGLGDGEVFNSYPEDAKLSLMEAWDNAEAVKREHDEYYAETNKIPLLAQINYDKKGVEVAVSVLSNADDDMSQLVKERFNEYADVMRNEAGKKITMPSESPYLTLYIKDKPQADWLSYKLRNKFKDVMEKANMELLVLRETGVQVAETESSYEEPVYSNLASLRELCMQRAHEEGYRSMSAYLTSVDGLSSVYQHIIREEQLKEEDPKGKLRWRGKTISKYATLLGVSIDVLDDFVDVK